MKLKLPTTLALASALLLSAPAGIAGESDKWSFDASLNRFMADLSGDVTAKGQPAKVDASFSEILDQREAGAAGRFTVGYDCWLVSTEFSYMRLKASVPAADLELVQWLVEPSLGYKFSDLFTAFEVVAQGPQLGVTFHF